MKTPLGFVHLVGAGPGDPALITVAGLRALQLAQVVIFDRLVNRDLLNEAPTDAERIDVGKRPGDAPVTQDEINRMLVTRAGQGLRVVRLKGGDPFIFGRGFEELSACRDAGIDCIVVPGVSSAIAAPEVAGIPLTLRGVSRSFAVLTAETAPDTANAIDFSQLRGIDTLVILMGRSRLDSIARTLIAAGWSPATPVACIEQATTGAQRNISATLATIAALAERMELSAPMVTIIGQVARHCSPSPPFGPGRSSPPSPVFGPGESSAPSPSQGEGRGEGKDAQFDRHRPTSFSGRRILITRPQPAAQKLAAKLRPLGALPIECPLLRIVIPRENPAVDAAIANLTAYNFLAFTSVHGVKAFWRRLAACGFDARRLSGCKIAALGFATARRLRRYGLKADVTASSAGELALAKIAQSNGSPGKVLWPRGDKAIGVLRDKLTHGGHVVDDPVAYRTITVDPTPGLLDDIRRGVDAVLLHSPSAAKQFAALDLSLGSAIIVCVGPTTAAAASAIGLRVDAVAPEPSDDGVLTELERCFSGRVTV